RLEKYLGTGQFSDVNLVSCLWSQASEDAVKLSVFSVPGLVRMQVLGALLPRCGAARAAPLADITAG
ncbi:Glycoside hydrolase, 38 vacuolar alpha mannosidase, partial [Polyrhizophydium stewartii]